MALGYIGDSLTFQAGQGSTDIPPSLANVGWDVSGPSAFRLDGVVGRSIIGTGGGSIVSSLQVVQDWRTDGFDPETFIIALGSNNAGATDASWTSDINALLDEIANGVGTKVVHWVGIAFRDDVADTRATRFYGVLQAVAASRTDVDLRPVDYNTLIHAQPQSGLWDLDDTSGRHMTFAGYDVRNAVIADEVAVTNGGGSTGEPIVFSNTAGAAINSEASFTIPATAAVGDVAYAMIGSSRGSGSTIATPAGWTQLAGVDIVVSRNNQSTALFYKVLDAGDIGATFTSALDGGSRWHVAGLVIPDAGAATAASWWYDDGAAVASLTATAATGNVGDLVVVLASKRNLAAATPDTWSSAELTEYADVITTNASGARFGAWAGAIPADGTTQGPFTLTVDSANGSGAGYTFVVPANAPAPTPSGGSVAGLGVSTLGTGGKAAADGTAAPVGVSTTGTGSKVARGGSVAPVSLTSTATGHKVAHGGSSPTIATTPSGVGVKVGTGGTAALVQVDSTGDGHRVQAGSGGSVAALTIASTGDGSSIRQGASVVGVTVAAVGDGQRVQAGQGGSVATVHVTSVGTGRTIRSGGSVATVTLTTVGGGHNPDDARDITIVLGPPVPNGLQVGHPSRRAVAIGSPRR